MNKKEREKKFEVIRPSTSEPAILKETPEENKREKISYAVAFTVVILLAVAVLYFLSQPTGYLCPDGSVASSKEGCQQYKATPFPSYKPTATIAAVQTTPTAAVVTTQSCTGFEACGLSDGCCALGCEALQDKDCSTYALGEKIVSYNNLEMSLDSYSLVKCNGKTHLKADISVTNRNGSKHYFTSSNFRLYNFVSGNFDAPSSSCTPPDFFGNAYIEPLETKSGAVYFAYTEAQSKNERMQLGFLLAGGNYGNQKRYIVTVPAPVLP